MRVLPRWVFFAALASSPWLGCLPGEPAEQAARASIRDGVDDPGDPAVVAIVDEIGALRCTGTVVQERVVLTAAHCVPADPAARFVVFGPFVEGDPVALLDAVAHPDWSGDADGDVGLLLLAEPAAVAPVPLALDGALVAAPPVSVRLVGYGLTAAGAGDDDRKREGRAVTTEVSPGHVVLGPDPSLACNGDSGGPVLVTTAEGEAVAAVISRGDAACSTRSRAARLDASFEGFLRPTLEGWAAAARATGDACLYPEHCADGVCVEAPDEPRLRYCDAPCEADPDCPDAMRCAAGRCGYPTPSPGAFGGACAVDDDCLDGECLREDGICSARCVTGRGDCPRGATCAHLGGIDFFCVPDPAPSGCAVGVETRTRPPAWPMGALPLVWLLLRRPWARRRARPPRGSADRSSPRPSSAPTACDR